ncbi:DUF1501 domain-containing protein [Schlesneria paludicola]|uniref:DUF1501 domain-containing protein n=1 Tax=Schlesneria paludicola TaxID=360056 RepID=UPI00029AF25C|nr:DUF1501 domain-containing protein [Schlesneria paludicola]
MRLFTGAANQYCDRVSRRSFLQIGSLAVGGLTLPRLLQAETAAAARSHKAVIMVYLSGGMPHQDTFDLKMEAPAEIRGEFSTIPSVVPGIDVCELLPKMATVMDRCSVIRSVVGQRDEHSSFQNLTGYTMREVERNYYPNFGSMVAKVQGPTTPLVPPFVDLFPTMQHRPYNSTGAGYLGSQYNQVRADGEDLASMKLRYVESMQFANRQKLLEGLDGFRRTADRGGLDNLEESYRRAFEVLTSSKLMEAMDVSKEDPAVRARYAMGSSKHLGDGGPLWNDQLLIARRLVEAGVRVVTVAYGFWDTHGNNFGHLKAHLPTVDSGISALIEDIYQRGLGDDVSLVVWGEFGRTPKINKDAGRDHWAPVQAALMAGGGMKVGQVIGSTDRTGGFAESRPVHYRDVLATIYHNLGIDTHQFVRSFGDRPVPIFDEDARPIRELIG